MARIGDMPSAEEISGGGHLIYTEDGIHANKITIEDFANALDILMTNDGVENSGTTSSGLKYWKEYSNGDDVFLYNEHPDAVLTEQTKDTFSISIDDWHSNYQFDNWDSDAAVPNLPIENSVTAPGQDPRLYPYICFAMVSPFGSAVEDYTRVSEDIYKIKTTDIGKFKLTFFWAGPGEPNGSTHEGRVSPTDVNAKWIFNNTLYTELVNDSQFNPFSLIGVYTYEDLFETRDDAADVVDDNFSSTTSSAGAAIIEYYKHGHVINSISSYISTDSHEDDDEYTYIDLTGRWPEEATLFSLDGLNYTTYEDWNELIVEISNCKKTGGYTAISSKGIFINIPYAPGGNSKIFSDQNLYLSEGIYASDKVKVSNIGSDAIFVDELDDTDCYKEFVKAYINAQIHNSSYITNVSISNASVVHDGVAEINLGTGLELERVEPPHGEHDPFTYEYWLKLNPSELQPALTPGHGVSISNNVISFESDVTNVRVEGNSVVSNRIADITLPSGLKETRLQDGLHTEVETVSSGNNYVVKQINIVDIEQEVDTASATVVFGNIAQDTYVNDTAQSICRVSIPLNVSGLLIAEINVENTTNSDPSDYITMVAKSGDTFPTVQELLTTPICNTSPFLQPYTAEGNTYYPQSSLKATGIVTGSGGYFYLLVKVHATHPCTVYGKLTFIRNVRV